MKTGKFVYTLALSACFAACSKQDSLPDDSSNALVSARAASAPYAASNWESTGSWSKSDSSDYQLFAYSRSFPELTADVIANGAVLAYVKNLPYENTRIDKPVLTPFHVLPSQAGPGYDQMWYRVASTGNVTVKYRTNKQKYGIPADTPDGHVQFRIFVISSAELNRLGHTPMTIMRVSYSDLVQLLGASE